MLKVVTGLTAALVSILMAKVMVAAIYPTGFEPDNACVSNARIIASALQAYVQDYDEQLPNMQTASTFQTAITPFTPGNPQVFTCPDTGKGYVPNSALSNTAVAEYSSEFATQTFEDAQAHFGNHLKTIAYLDGHIDRGDVVQDGSPNNECIDNVKQLAVAVEMYTQDYDEKLPPTDSSANFETATLDYAKNPAFYRCPVTFAAYAPNPAISEQNFSSFANPSTTVELQDSIPHPDGAVTIAYLDGHVSNPDAPSKIACSKNLSSIGLALQLYTQDYDGSLPPTDSLADFKAALTPYPTYLPQTSFNCPDTGVPYTINTAISGENAWSLSPTTPILEDSEPNDDGSVNTLYINGSLTSQDYYLPSSLTVDAAGNPALTWLKSAGTTTAMQIWDLNSSGSVIQSFDYTNASAPFSPAQPAAFVTPIISDQRELVWASNNPLGTLPIKISITDPAGTLATTALNGPYDGWTAILGADGGQPQSHLLLSRYDGELALWSLTATGDYKSSLRITPPQGEIPMGMAFSTNDTGYILCSISGPKSSLLTISNNATSAAREVYTALKGDRIVNVAVGTDGLVRLLIDASGGKAQIWKLNANGHVVSTLNVNTSSGWTPAQIAVDNGGDYLVFWKQDGNAEITRFTDSGRTLYQQTFTPFQ